MVLTAVLVATLAAQPGWAQESRDYSDYEEDVIREALEKTESTIDPEPEGKLIEAIVVQRLDVFDHRDPVPNWVNFFHKTSRERVIRRELLFSSGDVYDSERIDESARNLRDIIQVSVVLILAVEGSEPDRVRVVVITKDIWSLRAAWDPQISGEGVSEMHIAADEINLLGQHKMVSLRGGFDPGSYYYGAGYRDPRVAGSRIYGATSAALVFDRDDGQPEGSFGWFWYGQGLYSLETKWAWGTFVAWRDDVERSYQGLNQRTYDASVTPFDDGLPYEWDRGVWYASNEVTRSFGRENKLDLMFGVEALRGEYSLLNGLEGDRRAVQEFRRREVPPNHQRLNPFIDLHAHSTRYLRTLDVNTLALQEDIQTGYDLTLRLFPASDAMGSTRSLMGMVAIGGYTVPLGDGFVRAIGSSFAEFAGDESDVLFDGRLHFVTPRLGFGRFVYDFHAAHRYRDFYRDRFVLGGLDRLRGYSAAFRRGKDLLASTFELRTTSLGLFGVELGAAAFYDVGDAADGFEEMDLRQTVGGGGRFLFPMFDRTVFRIDVGFPLDRDRQDVNGAGDPKRWDLAFSFEQAIPTPLPPRGRVPAALAIE